MKQSPLTTTRDMNALLTIHIPHRRVIGVMSKPCHDWTTLNPKHSLDRTVAVKTDEDIYNTPIIINHHCIPRQPILTTPCPLNPHPQDHNAHQNHNGLETRLINVMSRRCQVPDISFQLWVTVVGEMSDVILDPFVHSSGNLSFFFLIDVLAKNRITYIMVVKVWQTR